MHQYLSGRKVAIYGDPDHVIALTEFCRDMDMKPVHVLTGSVATPSRLASRTSWRTAFPTRT